MSNYVLDPALIGRSDPRTSATETLYITCIRSGSPGLSMRPTLFTLCYICWSAITAHPVLGKTVSELLVARHLLLRSNEEQAEKQKGKKEQDDDDDHGGMPSGILFISVILVLLACMVGCIILTCCLVRLRKKVKLLKDELESRGAAAASTTTAATEIAREYRASMFVKDKQRQSEMREHAAIPNTPVIMDEELQQAQHEPASAAPLYNQPTVSGHSLPYNISEISVSDIDLVPSPLKRPI